MAAFFGKENHLCDLTIAYAKVKIPGKKQIVGKKTRSIIEHSTFSCDPSVFVEYLNVKKWNEFIGN